MSKPREFWIHKAFEMGWTVHNEPIIARHPLEKSFHVREVMPDEPTGAEVFDRVIKMLKEHPFSKDNFSLIWARWLESRRDEILKGSSE